MGHMVLVVVGNVRGDEYSAKAATRAAIDCDADPMYMVFAEAWAAGLAIGSSTPEEARRCFEQVDAVCGASAEAPSRAPWLSSGMRSTSRRDIRVAGWPG